MCGILGIVAAAGHEPSLDDAGVARLRDLMAHRGPDGAGLWRAGPAVLAHRRLAVVDLSDAGAQPMATPEGRYAMVYNGQLYNDAEMRRELAAIGLPAQGFRGRCDTETVLHAFAAWGPGALARLRGMFALAVYDTRRRVLTLARDPLGVKPLYFWKNERELVFASEPGPILAHPDCSARPNFDMVSAYLTTIRTTLGADTLFQGVHAVRPGQMVECDVSGDVPRVRRAEFWTAGRVQRGGDAPARVRAAVTDSVARHLISDVPLCALLSGGLDSTVVATLASRDLPDLRTFCAGAAPGDDDAGAPSDLAFARLAAARLGSRHAEAIVTREMFAKRWAWMVGRLGVPLSTPNEVAIHEVASTLRGDGCIVTLSGEGADELFAGYEAPMLAAMGHVRGEEGAGLSSAMFELEANAWVPPGAKGSIVNPDLWAALENDSWVRGYYEQEFELSRAEAGDADPLEAHLRLQRRINLTGLLQRLDTATMLASVEGRTPFADARIAEIAQSLPMDAKFVAEPSPAGGVAVAARCRTKIALREAFRADLPPEIADRAKASFPLPFQAWVADHAGSLRRSAFARAVFTDAAVATVAGDTARHWRLAWPMINIALWGDRWWE